MKENHEEKIIEDARKRAANRSNVADISSIAEFAGSSGQEEGSLVLGETTDIEQFEESDNSIRPGTTINSYRIVEKVGQGGMGEVYLAHHLKFKSRLYAIKFLRKDLVNSATKSRFEAEIHAMEVLKHDNIVFAYDAGEYEGASYLVMDFIEGRSLKSFASTENLSIADAAEIIRQTAVGLQHAFENKMVHRDIKPSNLVLSKDGLIKILDMGLARITGANSIQLTGTQQVLGTPDYMAPEQWQDTRSVDIRADIYSLGCTLYYLLAGRAPFEDDEHSTLATKLSGHLQDPPPKIDLDGEDKRLEPILKRMLEKDPGNRFQTPNEVAEALAEFCGGANLTALTAGVQKIDVEKLNTRSIQDALVDTKTNLKANTKGTSEQTVSASDLNRVILFCSIALGICILLVGGFFALQASGFWNSADGPKEKAAKVPGVAKEPSHFSVNYISRSNSNLPADHAEQELIDKGEIGVTAFTGKFGDLVKVNFKLDEPGYFYLLALNPTNNPNYRIQLCYPDLDSKAPELKSTLTYPQSESSFFPMTDGVGQLAFVILMSDQPLPPFEAWKKQNIKDDFPWQISKQTGVWGANENGDLAPKLIKQNRMTFRGQVVNVKSDILQESIDYLRSSGVSVQVLAFPVLAD